MYRKAKNGRNQPVVNSSLSYGFTPKERATGILLGILKLAGIGYIFYKSLIGVLLLQLFLPLYLRIKEEECQKKHIQILKLEFKEMLLAYRSAIVAGLSPKNAIAYVREEMISLGYENGQTVKELGYMINQIKLNVSIPELFMDWGKRSKVEDIQSFANIFDLIEKTGGNLADIMKGCADIISEKIEVEREIDVIITSKKYEQKVINVIPLFLLLYVDMTSKGFLRPMYEGIFGRLIMTACMALYFVAYVLSFKIMSIEV